MPVWSDKRFLTRVGVITLLVMAYSMTGSGVNAFFDPAPDLTHFAYLPIFLSALWWHKKAVATALVLAVITVWRHPAPAGAAFLDTLITAAAFIVMAFVVGHLAEKKMAELPVPVETPPEANPARPDTPSGSEGQLIQSASLAELDEMAASMAHELNQPLTGIKNYAQNALYMLDEQKGSKEDIRDNLLQISRQVDRSTRIINQLRQLARNAEHHFSPLHINDIIKESLHFLAPHLQISGIKSKIILAENLPPIQGDKVRLEQVFINIITNARQAMEGAEKRLLAVETFLDLQDPLPVTVQIRDSGRGFPQEDAEKLFAPFYTTKNPGQGTGLGLTISLSIIKEHQGAITARSAVGQGACFTVKFPPLACNP